MTRFDKVYWTTWLAIDFFAFGLYWPAFYIRLTEERKMITTAERKQIFRLYVKALNACRHYEKAPHGTATSIDAALESADDAFRDYVDSLVDTKAT